MTFALTIRTPDQIAAAEHAAAMDAQKAECRARILAVVDETAQMNLTAAAVAGFLSPADMATYQAGLAWIGAMRAALATVPATWPDPPAGLADLARRF